MILRALTLIAVMLGLLAGQQMFGDSDKAAIEKMYSRYVAAFIKKDYAVLRECVHAPFIVWSGGEMQPLGSVDAVIENYRKQHVALDARSYGRADVTGMRITALSADSALINASFRRYKKDGSFLEDGAAIYPVCKVAGAWKLCGLMRQDPKLFGRDFSGR